MANEESSSYSIIAVGGFTEGGSRTHSVEILDRGANGWRPGPSLPFGLSSPVVVEDRYGGVVLVGGQTNEARVNTLYRLAHANSNWTLMEQKLAFNSSEHDAFTVGDEFCIPVDESTSKPTMTKLLVAGGFDKVGLVVPEVEVIDLVSSSSTCDDLASFEWPQEGNLLGVLGPGNRPLICGDKDCFGYSENGKLMQRFMGWMPGPVRTRGLKARLANLFSSALQAPSSKLFQLY